MSLKYYKALYRRVVRLPLDEHTLGLAKQKLHRSFADSKRVPTFSVVDRKLYDHAVSTMDHILINEGYKDFHRLLDLIYKDTEPIQPWVHDFQNTKYSVFKSIWPQSHVIDAFGDESGKAKYYKALRESEPSSSFSFTAALGVPDDGSIPTLLPLREHSSVPNNAKRLMEKAFNFHQFVSRNSNKLSEVKIQPFDVVYEPNRFGLPQSIAIRESKLKSKVNYAKNLLKSHRPIGYSHLMKLIAFVKCEDDTEINPGFFKFMLRKHKKEEGEISPHVAKFVRHKQLIPNKRNVSFYYRQYVVRQFYLENEVYKLSPMINIYD